MADPAMFDHDRLAHLLADRLLRVPRFQRAYAWDESNVREFLEDLDRARVASAQYFMGTVVLAADVEDPTRHLIVDGQQRLTTTALLLIAVRDRLRELNRSNEADSIDQQYLKRFELEQGETVTRLILNPRDLPAYDALIEQKSTGGGKSQVERAYAQCRDYVISIAPSEADYKVLIDLVTQVGQKVQILLAVASSLPEAYIIFETLNDRGADLTTADLLKNYLFSQAGQSIQYIENRWTAISATFDKAEDLVKFIRWEYSSRRGRVTNRKLYRALQEDIGATAKGVKLYVQRLEESLSVFTALRDPEHQRWGSLNFDVRDSLLAFRRFGFESSTPLLLAAFSKWSDQDAGRLLNLVASWSVRAMMAGKLGGGSAEEVFCEAAVALSDGVANNQPDVRKVVAKWVPDDQEFRSAFMSFGSITTTRAKYLLARLERQLAAQMGKNIEALPDWSTKTVTVEHVLAQSTKAEAFPTPQEFEDFKVICNQLENFTLLERSKNKNLEDKPFSDKREVYLESSFLMTQELGKEQTWTLAEAKARSKQLADLAVKAWPR